MRRLAAALVLCVALRAVGQIELGDGRAKEQVVSLIEPQRVEAGKMQPVGMLFRVLDGYHINSHTPKSEELIATVLTLEPMAGVTVGPIDYPQGHAYHFDFDPKETLDVYAGEVRIAVPVRAKAGSYMLRGVLHYQACDNAMCYPPRDLPVVVEVVAR